MNHQKTFIASPAGIDTCRKVKPQKAEVLSINKDEYKETMLQSEGMENEKPRCDMLSEKKFITSPADVDTHRKVKLQDAEVLSKYKIVFEKLCEEYDDIFSKGFFRYRKNSFDHHGNRNWRQSSSMSKAI